MSVTALSDAKAYLNITDSEHDAEVQATLNRAEGMIASRVGPLVLGEVVERVAGGEPTLRLTQPPVASLTSLVDADGAAVDISDLVVTRSGVVSGMTFASRYYDVTYQCGYSSPLPAGISEGILAMTSHLWGTQRGVRRPGATPDRQTNLTGAAYTWPYRVTEAIADYVKVGV